MEILALFLPYLRAAPRLVHLISAMYWIGTTLYLNRLARNATPVQNDPNVMSRLYLIHGGKVARLERLTTTPNNDETIHWFKWESLSTWISGMVLLAVNFWVGSDKALPAYGLLVFGTIIYALIWRWIKPGSPLESFAIFASWLGLMALTWGFEQFLDSFMAFYFVGATLATIMAIYNVWGVILPSQQKMLRDGGQIDTALAARAMRCTQHNMYIMPTVVLMMMQMHISDVLHGDMDYWRMGIISLVGGLVGHLLRKKL